MNFTTEPRSFRLIVGVTSPLHSLFLAVGGF